MNILYNLLITFYYFIPIWAFLLWKYVKIGGKYTFLTVEIALFILTVWFAYNPTRIPKITSWIHWYFFYLMAYNFILVVKFGYANFGKVIALSLWMIFIAGEWWELPVFIYDGFGYLNGWHTWNVTITEWISSHIHRAYVFVTLILMVKLTSLKLNIKNGLLILAGTFFSIVGLYPWSNYHPLSTLIHITSLSLFAFIIYFGEPKLGTSLVGI